MAKYKKRADGRFYTLVSTGKYEDDGKPIRIPVYGTSSRDLENKVADIKVALKHGTYADDKGKTVGEYAQEWLKSFHPGNKGYSNIIRNHFERINDIKLLDLTLSNVQGQINAKEGHYDIQRRIKITINQILECAIDDGLIYKNVSRKATLPKKPKPDKRALYQYEIDAIKRADFTPKERIFVLTLFYFGLRRGEALALTRNSFDFKKNLLHVTNAVSFDGEHPIIGDPKTIAGDRYIPIVSSFSNELKAYIDSLDSFMLFPNKNGSVMSKTSFRRFWDGIIRKINTAAGGKQHYDSKNEKKWVIDINNVPGLTPHIFRHNYATTLYYGGVDLKDAQNLLGHADAKTIIEIYTHLDKEKSKSADKIEKIFQAI